MLNPGKHKQHKIEKESKPLNWKNESNLYIQQIPAAFNYILNLRICVSNPEQKSKNEDQEQIPIQKFLQFLCLCSKSKFLVPAWYLLPTHSFLVPVVVQNRSQRPPCQLWQIEKNNHWPLSVYYVHLVSFAYWGFNCRLTNSSKASFIHTHWHTSLASATVICITQHKGNLEHTTSNDM